MSGLPQRPVADSLDPEKVAYWYFRLNGFFQIENFVVHPERRRDGQRTDADLLAVRFPFRAERLIDNPNDIMVDDGARLKLSRDLTDVVIAEVTGNQPCKLNGPWTRKERQNVHRVLAAIGCLPENHIEPAASDIYKDGVHVSKFGLRIRLVAVGRERDDDLAKKYPGVTQLIWSDLLAFMWNRFHAYRRQKRDVHQWDAVGKKIKQLADRSCDTEMFAAAVLPLWECGMATMTKSQLLVPNQTDKIFRKFRSASQRHVAALEVRNGRRVRRLAPRYRLTTAWPTTCCLWGGTGAEGEETEREIAYMKGSTPDSATDCPRITPPRRRHNNVVAILKN